MPTLVVQRGHVARTSGATGAPGEQAMARRVAAAIAELIKDVPNWDVRIINADEPTSRYAGDAFVSLHGDGGSPQAHGASVGYRTSQGRELGQAWKRAYEEAGWSRGWRKDNYTTALARYYGTGHASSAGNPRAVIVEHGFMTNAKDRAFIDSPEGVRAAAVACVAAVCGLKVSDLMKGARVPETETGGSKPPSTAPSHAVITVGDSGPAVRAWQEDLMSWKSDDPDAHPADGEFGPKTARWTARFMKAVGLVSQEPERPVVGPRTQAAMDKELSSQEASGGGSSSSSGVSFSSSAQLQRGDKGAGVREWQQALVRWRSSALPRFGADGDFGAETADWTGRFMVAAGLVSQSPRNPIVGPRTRQAMVSALGGASAPSAPSAPSSGGGYDPGRYRGRLLRQPPIMNGGDVERFQRAINAIGSDTLAVDGAYGPKSEAACRSFQGSANIKVDGIVGPVTWRVLRERSR